MSKNIFIATAEPYSGKSIVAIGLVNMLLGKTKKVGYFKPIINNDPKEKKDDHIATVIEHFGLPLNYNDAFAFTRAQALQMIQNKSQGEMTDIIISKFKNLEEAYDFTVIEGSDFVGEGIAFEFDANISMAKNLSAPVIIVISGENKTTAQVVTSTLTVFHNFQSHEVQVLAIVVNRVNSEQAEDVKQLLTMQLHNDIIVAIIPLEKSLKSPTMKEINEHLGGKLLFGEDQLSNQVDNFITGAMQVPHFLKHLYENVLIVTPGDRADIIITALQANLSTSYPKVSGIILSGSIQPDEPVMQLIRGSQTIVPIIAVETGTFKTTAKLDSIQSKITPDNKKKIQLAIDVFEKYVDVKALDEKMITFKPEGVTPHMFQYQLVKWARNEIKHIV
ncbi:MAG TPA: AAA family ATPase, partial [Chitinophagaceae bacterium]